MARASDCGVCGRRFSATNTNRMRRHKVAGKWCAGSGLVVADPNRDLLTERFGPLRALESERRG